MSAPIQVIAIIKPKPGNIDAVIEGMKPLIDYVQANEPDVLQYQMLKQVNPADGEECLVFIETYKNKEAIAAHQQNPVYVALQEKAKEDSSLLAAPIEIKVLEAVAGFESR